VTIRTRLAIAYGGVAIMILIVLGAVVWWRFGVALRSSLDQTLQERATSTIDALQNDGQGQAGLQEGDVGLGAGTFIAVFDGQGHLVDATSNSPTGLALPAAGYAGGEISVGDTLYEIAVARADGGPTVVAGSKFAVIDDTLVSLGRLLLAVGGAAAALAFLGGWWFAGRALRPVALLTSEAAQIGAGDLERRLPPASHRDELGALTDTLNGMLDRVEDSVRHQRAFIAAASHDLRTPVSALQAELELADTDRSTPRELRAAVRRARADALRLGELATALLDLASVETGGRVLVLAPVHIDDLIAGVVRRVMPVAREREILVRHDAPTLVVEVDRVRLEQAVANLVLNAIEYSPAGSAVEVHASLDPSDESSRTWLLVEVRDSGPGVPESFVDRLFRPFERGPNATGSGAGLGLASAAAAIEAHDGTIGYQPGAGGGSRFWIRLPVGTPRRSSDEL
jgi:two-component system OmpR family sensor kinase